jgi:hypothetical protein
LRNLSGTPQGNLHDRRVHFTLRAEAELRQAIHEDAMSMLKKIELNGSNTNDAIVPFDTQYLVRVCGRWRAGTFAQQWHGLTFVNYGSGGIELEAIDEVYEITEAVVDTAATLPVAYLEYA